MLPDGKGNDQCKGDSDRSQVEPRPTCVRVLGVGENLESDPEAGYEPQTQPNKITRRFVCRPDRLVLGPAHADSHRQCRCDKQDAKNRARHS